MKPILLLFYYFRGVTLAILFFTSILFAQWSDDPSQNLQIADLTGDQTLAKISNIDGGGCFISWFDNRDGNYSVFLQRLNPEGNKQFEPDGLLISGNSQNSSLVDYDLMTDADGNAIITFTDVRTGSMNVFAYKISPAGDFLWGADGINLSTSSDFQANPKVTQTTNGNYVFAWIIAPSVQSTALQKLDSNGNKLWGIDPIIYNIDAEDNISYPVVVPTIEDGVILTYTAYTGPFFSASAKLFAQKFDSSGTSIWGNDGIPVQNLGGIAGFHVPQTTSDGNNGAYIAWHDDRDNNTLASAFIQHINFEGYLLFGSTAAEASLSSNRNKFNPRIAFNQSNGDVVVFWIETNSNQSLFGIYGQKFSSTGQRLWTDFGYEYLSLDGNGLSSLNAHSGGNNNYAFFIEGTSGINNIIKGFSTDSDGNMNWGGFVTLSNVSSEKLQMVSIIDQYNVCKMAWGDRRNDGGGIYAQNINSDGTLGYQEIPVELVSFTANVVDDKVELNWETATEINNRGFSIERKKTEDLSKETEWKTIGFVEGKGTTTDENSYSFIDKNLTSGNYEYRLKQIDFDGSYEYSNIIEVEIAIPDKFSLEQNYPNPFNPATTIKYTIPKTGLRSPLERGQRGVSTVLTVYDILGNEIATLVNEEKEPGVYEVNFNASNLPAGRQGLSSGIYYYKLQAGDYVESKKMILLK